jgi:hypothetical protein
MTIMQNDKAEKFYLPVEQFNILRCILWYSVNYRKMAFSAIKAGGREISGTYCLQIPVIL